MPEIVIGPEDLSIEPEDSGIRTEVRKAGVKLDKILRPEQEAELSPRENLIVYLQAAADQIDPLHRQYRLPLLRIIMPCGKVGEYMTENNIPVLSDPCTCGHPKHWFLKFLDIDGNPMLPAPKKVAQPKAAPKKPAKKS